MDVIATTDLGKRYGATTAVADLSLRVGRGEIYAFLGLNGAGKTTTIRMLLAMLRPTAGAAFLFGSRVHAGARELWARVGYLVDLPFAYPELTVRENLEVARRLYGVARPGAVDRVLERLALGAYAHRRAAALSLGNRQRLGLARALLHEPELLVLDEPANDLDPAGVVEVRRLLRELARERGVTIFMSSHILGEVARLATRLAILHRGRLLAEVAAADLEGGLGRTLVVDARDRAAARAALAAHGLAVAAGADGTLEIADPEAVAHPDRIARLLVAAGVPPTLLAVRQEDLESYFLRRVGAGGGDGS